jgi:hypothetical protein
VSRGRCRATAHATQRRRRALKALCDLYALRCIEKDMLFRNDEYVAPAKVRAVCTRARSGPAPAVCERGA